MVYSNCKIYIVLGLCLKRSLNRNVVISASKQKQILKKFFEITSDVSMMLLCLFGEVVKLMMLVN